MGIRNSKNGKLMVDWCPNCAWMELGEDEHLERMFAYIVITYMRPIQFQPTIIYHSSHSMLKEGELIVTRDYSLEIPKNILDNLKENLAIKPFIEKPEMWKFMKGVLKDSVEGVIKDFGVDILDENNLVDPKRYGNLVIELTSKEAHKC